MLCQNQRFQWVTPLRDYEVRLAEAAVEPRETGTERDHAIALNLGGSEKPQPVVAKPNEKRRCHSTPLAGARKKSFFHNYGSLG
jgi:hypothetical protein